jgi:hypothetical protein
MNCVEQVFSVTGLPLNPILGNPGWGYHGAALACSLVPVKEIFPKVLAPGLLVGAPALFVLRGRLRLDLLTCASRPTPARRLKRRGPLPSSPSLVLRPPLCRPPDPSFQLPDPRRGSSVDGSVPGISLRRARIAAASASCGSRRPTPFTSSACRRGSYYPGGGDNT